MNPIFDFTVVDHAAMVSDQVRLESYRRAIENQVKPNTVVVEVGTGTGILSAYVAAQTKNQITAIEFAEPSAKLAEDMMVAAGLKNVKILRGKSYDITLSPEPEVLVTETIGAIGPEENIVEICYDFKKRHPRLSTFIPSHLKVWAQPIRSEVVVNAELDHYAAFKAASFGTFNYDAIRPALSQFWTSYIRYAHLGESTAVGDPVLLADYHLGVTQDPAFTHEIDVSGLDGVDAIHLYFEAQLDPDVMLSTHFLEPETHWRQAYVSKPKNCTRLWVSYSKASDYLEVSWKV